MIEINQRAARVVAFIAAAVIILIVILSVSKCGNDKAVKQAEQTTRSSEAIADAASNAVGAVVKRTNAEKDIEAATAKAKEEIGNAASNAEIRAAVTNSVCLLPEYANDPTCKVR